LQALNLLNDVTFVEAARVLAERVLREEPEGTEARVKRAVQLVTARRPGLAELQILVDGLRAYRARYASDSEAARQLTSIGAAGRNETLDAGELAAFTALGSVLLNLDETITKE